MRLVPGIVGYCLARESNTYFAGILRAILSITRVLPCDDYGLASIAYGQQHKWREFAHITRQILSFGKMRQN